MKLMRNKQNLSSELGPPNSIILDDSKHYPDNAQASTPQQNSVDAPH
jgi:hypothetical protein